MITEPGMDSKYTTNINTQNELLAGGKGNLSECAEPLVQMINELTDQGKHRLPRNITAHGAGCFIKNTDIWRVAAPMDGPTWEPLPWAAPGCVRIVGALSIQPWIENFEKTILLWKALRFLWIFSAAPQWKMAGHQSFHFAGKNFPDGGNKPYFDEVTAGFREGTTICAGSSIDMQILYDLFGYYIEASEIWESRIRLYKR